MFDIPWILLPILTLGNIAIIYRIESSSKTKGSIIRPNDKGERRFHISSYLNLLLSPINIRKPLVAKFFWKPENWDLNIILNNIVIITGYYLITS